jgi:phosphomannomutase
MNARLPADASVKHDPDGDRTIIIIIIIIIKANYIYEVDISYNPSY